MVGGVGVELQFWWSIKTEFWRKANLGNQRTTRAHSWQITTRLHSHLWKWLLSLCLIHISAVSLWRHYLSCHASAPPTPPFFFFLNFPLHLPVTQRHKCRPLSKVHPIVCLPSLNLSTPRCFAECVYLVRQWQVMVMASITELVLSHR